MFYFLTLQSALREGLKKLFHTHSVSSSTEIFSKRRKIYSLWRKTRVKWSSETWVLILCSLPFACGFQWISLHGGFMFQHQWFSMLAPFFLSLYHSLVVFNESHQHWHLTVWLLAPDWYMVSQWSAMIDLLLVFTMNNRRATLYSRLNWTSSLCKYFGLTKNVAFVWYSIRN